MSDPKRAMLRRQRVDAYLGVVIRRAGEPRRPSREELRAMIADAARNTALLPLPDYAHRKTRSEQGGGSA